MNVGPVSRAFFLVVLLASASACTTQSVYEGIRHSVRRDCNRLAEPERTDCLEKTSDDYDTYRRKREVDDQHPVR